MRVHLNETIAWIKRAQDAQPDGGVSAVYSPLKGWHRSYPETTGYIIPTLLDHWAFAGDPDCLRRSVQMAEWLLKIQLDSGAFPGGAVGQSTGPSVFNTGQILFGLLGICQATSDLRYLDAARRAGNWLVSVQEPGGEWARWDFLGKSHSYNTRTAWALLLLHGAAGDPAYLRAARANLDWTLTQVRADGFIDRCAFDPLPNGDGYRLAKALCVAWKEKSLPAFLSKASLHTIAYTLQGLLECAWILADGELEAAARKGCDVLAAHALCGGLAGFYDPGWRPATRSKCVTGLAQMAVVWLRLCGRGDARYLEPAKRACAEVQSAQNLSSRNPALRGALPGSKPISGTYLPFRYPNWAAKFAADAFHLLLTLDAEPDRRRLLRVW